MYYSPGFKIVDKKTGDEYMVRGYDGGAMNFSNYLENLVAATPTPSVGFADQEQRDIRNERGLS